MVSRLFREQELASSTLATSTKPSGSVVETRLNGVQEVGGSIPLRSTTSVAPRVRVVAWNLAKVQVPGSTPGGRSTSCLLCPCRLVVDLPARNRHAAVRFRSGAPHGRRNPRITMRTMPIGQAPAFQAESEGFDSPSALHSISAGTWRNRQTREALTLLLLGSSPSVPSTSCRSSSHGRTRPWYGRGFGFESRDRHHIGLLVQREDVCFERRRSGFDSPEVHHLRTVAQRQSGWFIPSEPGVRVPPVRPS